MSPVSTRSRFALLSLLVAAASSLGCTVPGLHFGYGGGIIGLVCFILWIIAIVQIIQSGMDSTKKLIWILVVLFLPFIGSILWFIIGNK
jgi:hypothetical protein